MSVICRLPGRRIQGRNVLIRHNYKETFGGVFVRLQLVVGAVHSRASSKEKKQFAGRMRVVGRLGDIYFDVVELGDFLVEIR